MKKYYSRENRNKYLEFTVEETFCALVRSFNITLVTLKHFLRGLSSWYYWSIGLISILNNMEDFYGQSLYYEGLWNLITS